MGIITGVVAIGFLLLMGVVVYSIFSETIDTIWANLQEKRDQQEEQAPPDETVNGNLASNTGTRVCDLDMELVGTVYDPTVIDVARAFEEQELALWVGQSDINWKFEQQNTNIIDYTWFCSGETPASLLEMLSFYNRGTLEQLSLFGQGTVETDKTIRIYFEAKSMDSGKKMYADQKKDAGDRDDLFSRSIVIEQDTPLPTSFSLPISLYDVTEDDYHLKFWSDELNINDKMPNYKLKYNLCSPSKSSCG
jgi:hypothetical protein